MTFDLRNGTVVAGIVAVVTMVGTIAGVYSTLHGDLVECKVGIEAMTRRLDDTIAAQKEWDKEERATDLEVRARLTDVDRQIRDDISRIADRVDSLIKARQ